MGARMGGFGEQHRQGAVGSGWDGAGAGVRRWWRDAGLGVWGGGSGRMPTSPGTSKREKQFQAHRAFGDRRDGVVSARTYFYASEAKCDSHMETFLRCIEASGGVLLVAGLPPARPSLG